MQPLNHDAILFLERLVLRYMDAERSFTSVDIANQAKAAGHFARNRMVAEWLRCNAIKLAHAYSHLYNQTLIEVDSKADGHTLAYLYHHMHVDPDTYLDRDQNPKSYQQPDGGTVLHVIAAVTGQTPNPSTTTTGGKHHSNYQRRDAFGRFV